MECAVPVTQMHQIIPFSNAPSVIRKPKQIGNIQEEQIMYGTVLIAIHAIQVAKEIREAAYDETIHGNITAWFSHTRDRTDNNDRWKSDVSCRRIDIYFDRERSGNRRLIARPCASRERYDCNGTGICCEFKVGGLQVAKQRKHNSYR